MAQKISRWLILPLLVSLNGCLFSGSDTISADRLAEKGWSEPLEVERHFIEGSGADGVLERVKGRFLFHSETDYSWDSYTSPYRNSWRPHMALGTRAEVERVLYLLVDVTDTVAVKAGEVTSLFLSLTDPDSIEMALEFPEDTAFGRLLDSTATFSKKKSAEISISWKILGAAEKKGADSLRQQNALLQKQIEKGGFSDPLELEMKRAQNDKKWAVWSAALPQEVKSDLLPKKGDSSYRFLLLKLHSKTDPPIRLVSPFGEMASTGFAPQLRVGDWATRPVLRSAEELLTEEPTSLVLRSGVRESLWVHLPVDQMLDTLSAKGLAALQQVVVRAKLQLIPAAPIVATFEKEFGAVPLEARVAIDTANAIKKYNYSEPQTGNFADSAHYPENWIYSGAPSRSETLTVELGEAVRRALFAGSDRGVRVLLHLGRRVIDTTSNFQGSNQLLPITLDQIDLGDPSQLRWRFELQSIAP